MCVADIRVELVLVLQAAAQIRYVNWTDCGEL